MATQKQTKWLIFLETSRALLIDVIFYIRSMFKLYLIGIFALLHQLFEKSTTVSLKEIALQHGKTAIVTGGGAGIGFYITKKLASLGAHVIIASRCREQGESAIAKIKEDHPNATVEFMRLDLASLDSVQNFVKDFLSKNWPLHVLINNAGVMLIPCQRTEDGIEYHLQVNFLSHAVLTELLLDKMESTAAHGDAASVVSVSSVAHKVANLRNNVQHTFESCKDDWSYSPHNAYAVSKLAIVAHTYALSKRLAMRKSPVTVNVVHPGIVDSNLYCHVHPAISWLLRIFKRFLFMSAEEGSLRVLHAALSPDANRLSGLYYSSCRLTVSSPLSYSSSLQEYIYNRTRDVVQRNQTEHLHP